MKDIEKQLRRLGSVKPDPSWKEENRNILYTQVNNSHWEEEKRSLADKFREAFVYLRGIMSKPAWAVALISLLVISGGAGAQMTQQSKPGDTFYFAKKLTEKARLAVIFNEREKTRMSLRFAGSHARDISEALSETSLSDREAAELRHDFKKEISSMRRHLDSLTAEDAEEEKGEQMADKENEEEKGEEATPEQEREEGVREREAEDRAPASDEEVALAEEGTSRGGEETDEAGNTEEAEETENIVDTEEEVEREEESEESEAAETETAEPEEDEEGAPAEEEGRVFSVDFGKEEAGKEIHTSASGTEDEEEDRDLEEVRQDLRDAGRELEDHKEVVDIRTRDELYSLLEDAEFEFERRNYAETGRLLEEFARRLDGVLEDEEAKDEETGDGEETGSGDSGEGEVKGASDATTSTEAEDEAAASGDDPEDGEETSEGEGEGETEEEEKGEGEGETEEE